MLKRGRGKRDVTTINVLKMLVKNQKGDNPQLSLLQLSKKFQFSVMTASYHMSKLANLGYIEREKTDAGLTLARHYRIIKTEWEEDE